MEFSHQRPSMGNLLLLCTFLFTITNASLAISYCSTDNTAAGNALWSEYQSTGLCGDQCQGAFAFAVLQGNNCWCSNYAPADQEDTLKCNEGCPGISTEWCGSTDAELYGYFQLPGGKPLGTSGSSPPPSSSSSSVSTSTRDPSSQSYPSSSIRSSSSRLVTVVSIQSSAQTRPSSSIVPTTRSSSSVWSETSTEDPSSSSPSPSPSPTPSPSPSTSTTRPSPSPTPETTERPEVLTSVTTVTGQVRTVLVTPSANPTTDASHGQVTSSGKTGLTAGTVAGIVVGIVVGLAIIVALIFYLVMRRRRSAVDNMSPDGSFIATRSGGSSNGNSVPSRHASQMSQAGLLNKGPRIMTTGIPAGDDPRSANTVASNSDRRSMPTDQRLNPWALYQEEARMSNVSLQDAQDYSRQLRVANPDP